MNLPNNSASKELPTHRRHDIDDHIWALLESHLLGCKSALGGITQDRIILGGSTDSVFGSLAGCFVTTLSKDSSGKFLMGRDID
ncbi:MAG: hypothetical protein LBH31_02655 [Burkholderiaceae bacterium]|jgi:hypothetical protein|nr:hypothetical protein [Burkholderiaceae bacterium]